MTNSTSRSDMRQGILFVGNFLSSSIQHRHYCEDLTDRLETRGWPIVRTSVHKGRFRRLVDMMAVAWSQRDRYDVAHVDVFSGSAFVWAELVCAEVRRLGKPLVLTLRGGNLPDFARRWPRRVRRLLASATQVTAPSSYLQEAMLEHRNDIVIIPNAVDTARLEFRFRERAAARMIWVRSLHQIYNPVLAIDVLAKVSHDVPDATLTMIGHDKGDGSLEAVRARARELRVEDRIHLIGGVPKARVGEYLAKADIFLNTTDFDNTPVSVVEAMAAGLCVVSTSVGGIPFLLRNEEDSLLLPPRDATAMAAAVVRIVEDAELASRMSRTARARAAGWDWTPVLDEWERVLHATGHHA